jgi:hypothetical protein
LALKYKLKLYTIVQLKPVPQELKSVLKFGENLGAARRTVQENRWDMDVVAGTNQFIIAEAH